jgi:hypothetical protein
MRFSLTEIVAKIDPERYLMVEPYRVYPKLREVARELEALPKPQRGSSAMRIWSPTAQWSHI